MKEYKCTERTIFGIPFKAGYYTKAIDGKQYRDHLFLTTTGICVRCGEKKYK